MTVGEKERLRVLRAEGGNLHQLRVSPHQGRLFSRASIVLARPTAVGRVDHACFLNRAYRLPGIYVRVAPLVKARFDVRYVYIIACFTYITSENIMYLTPQLSLGRMSV